MKIVRIPELNVWVVPVYENGEEQLPKLEVFNTRDEARDYAKGNKPSHLSKFKLFFESLTK